MLRTFKRSIAVLVAASILVPSLSFAQPKKKPIRDTLSVDAQKQWDAALDLYKHNNWDGARTSFYAAYEASHNPRILFNVAVCERNLQHYARAIDTLKREITEGAGTLPADEEALAKQQIAGLEQFVAHLTIDVSEAGADIYVDEQKVGTSPLAAPVSVQLGERRVRVTKPGFAEATDTVDLKGGSSGRVSIKLSAIQKTALVNVNVIGPTSADVYIDNRLVGPAPYTGQVPVQAEPHQFSAQAPGWNSAPLPMVIKEGEAQNITLRLSQEQEMGKLIVVTRPEGAIIEIDGKVVGATHWEGPVTATTHQVAAKKQGFYDSSIDVEVPKGGTRNVTASLNENRNTSFVPWLIGTVLVVGTGAVVTYFVFRPKDEDKVNGTLPPFTVGTPSIHWR